MYLIVYTFLVLGLLLTPVPFAHGSGLKFDGDFDQGLFKDLSKQIGIALSYVPLSPAEPLGITGFDIGIEVTVADIDEDNQFWEDAVEDGDVPSVIALPKLHVQKGLPWGLDVGFIYAKVPGIDITLIGGELKWAFLEGGLSTPALAIRGSHTRLLGVNELNLQTYSADLSISKGFAIFIPYAGIGQIWIISEENSDLIKLDKESLSVTKGFIGVKVSFLLVSFMGEIAYSEVPLYSARANIGF